MADTTRKSDAGIGGTGEDATSKTPLDAGRNVGAGRAGGAGTVADDGTRAERYADTDAAQAEGDGSRSSGKTGAAGDTDGDRRPILGSGTIGVAAGNAADRPTRLTDAAPAYVPRDVYGTGDRPAATPDAERAATADTPDADGAPAAGGLAAVSGEQPPEGSDALDRPEKQGFLHGLDDKRPGR